MRHLIERDLLRGLCAAADEHRRCHQQAQYNSYEPFNHCIPSLAKLLLYIMLEEGQTVISHDSQIYDEALLRPSFS